MSQWIRKTLGELCDIGAGEVKTGPFGAQLHQSDYSDEGTPVVMPADIDSNGINEEKIARVSQSHVERLHTHKLSVGDIIYGRRGDIGRQALIKKKYEGWLCGTGCLRISLGNSEVMPEFLHLYLRTNEVINWIKGQAIGATMPNLNTTILRRVPVFFPASKSEQKKIAAILSAYDDLIETNKQRIALLEKMAEEIYREWFVRFRFPGWQNTEFFKNIPKGWEPITVKSLVKRIHPGKLYDQKTAYAEGIVPILDQGRSGIIGFHNDQPGVEASLDSPLIVFANHTCYQRLIFHPFSTIQNVLPFTPKEKNINIYWLHYATKDCIQLSEYKGHWPAFMATQIYKPSVELTKQFGAFVQPILRQVYQLELINRTLSRNRDLLLPRLISGKLSVDNLDIEFPSSLQ